MSSIAQLQQLLCLEEASEHEVAEVLQERLTFSVKLPTVEECDPHGFSPCNQMAGGGSYGN